MFLVLMISLQILWASANESATTPCAWKILKKPFPSVVEQIDAERAYATFDSGAVCTFFTVKPNPPAPKAYFFDQIRLMGGRVLDSTSRQAPPAVSCHASICQAPGIVGFPKDGWISGKSGGGGIHSLGVLLDEYFSVYMTYYSQSQASHDLTSLVLEDGMLVVLRDKGGNYLESGVLFEKSNDRGHSIKWIRHSVSENAMIEVSVKMFMELYAQPSATVLVYRAK